jgi:hypothetical protein
MKVDSRSHDIKSSAQRYVSNDAQTLTGNGETGRDTRVPRKLSSMKERSLVMVWQ